jgi:hypothetical protein
VLGELGMMKALGLMILNFDRRPGNNQKILALSWSGGTGQRALIVPTR